MKLIVDVLKGDYEAIINHCDDYVKSLYSEPEERCILAVKNGIPLEQHEFNLFKELREEIAKEAELAYADFDAYKESVLETEADDLPDDDFRYGMERCMVIINNTINHLKKEGMT